MKGLDLRKFKKMASDSKCTTLKSPEGHKIIIAHHAVSPAMRKELDAIPKKYAHGGGTEEDTDYGTSSDVSYPVEQPAQDSAPVIEQAPENRREMAQERDPAAVSAPAPVVAPPPVAAAPAAHVPQAAPIAPAHQAPAQPAQPAIAPQEAIPEEAPEQPAAAQNDYQKSYDDYKREHQQQFAQEDAAWAQDLANGHVRPETYRDLYNKKDTLGKIGMLFGVMVSGMGAGLTHQPNAALAAMNQEIKNDLDAQTKSKDNAQNFLKLNQEQMRLGSEIALKKQQGMLTEAQTKAALAEANLKSYALANMQYNRTALHHQSLMVEKMPEGPMKQTAMQALAMMGTAVTNENAQIGDIAASKMALMKSMGGQDGGMNGTALKIAGQDKLAADQEEKTVPGFHGRASIPVPQEKRDQLTAQKQYDEKAQEYVNFAKQHSKNWANMNLMDRQKIANQGASMGANLQSLYRNKIKGGTYKEGEQEFIQKVIPNQPAKWSASFSAIPKVEQTIHDNQNDLKNTAASVGLKYEAPTLSKSGRQIVQKDGKWVYK